MKIIFGFALLVLFYFTAFFKIDSPPIQTWDESRLAVNAIEMYKNNNFIVSYFEGKPDMWNTKPTLLIFLQTMSMKIFGINEFSIRFPIIISLVLISFTLVYFLKKELHNYFIGILSVFILITIPSFNNFHGFRTGDYDTLLILFTTIFSFSYYLYLKEFKAKYLYIFALSVALAILTKSISGLMFMPGLLAHTLYKKKLLKVLKRKELYISIFFIISITAAYYLYRESINEGYLLAVWNNELGGRFVSIKKDDTGVGPFYFYIADFFRQTFPWYIPFILGLFFLKKLNKNQKKIFLFSIFNIVFYTIFISISKTKLMWYIFPIYPFLSLIIAIFIYNFYEFIIFKFSKKHAYVFIVLMFSFPIISSIIKNSKTNSYHFIKQNIAKYSKQDNLVVCVEGYQPVNIFYIQKYKLEGYKIDYKMKHELDNEEIVFVTQNNVSEFIKKHYNFEDEVIENGIIKYNIKSKR